MTNTETNKRESNVDSALRVGLERLQKVLAAGEADRLRIVGARNDLLACLDALAKASPVPVDVDQTKGICSVVLRVGRRLGSGLPVASQVVRIVGTDSYRIGNRGGDETLVSVMAYVGSAVAGVYNQQLLGVDDEWEGCT